MDGSESNLGLSDEKVTSGGSLLIEARAQAMTIDDSTELWTRMKGNPVVTVSLEHHTPHDYSIIGRRVADTQELFNCKLSPSTHYQQADPTFHHWTTGNQRHGVTFLVHSDARRFERLARKAIRDLAPKRDSQSEEEIFMNLALDRDPTTQSEVPLRPHKPRRLTEEYRLSGSSKDSQSKQKCSTSSDEDFRGKGSPVGASRKSNSSPSSDTSIPARTHTQTSSSKPHAPLSSSRENIIGSSLATDVHSQSGESRQVAKANIYVQPTQTIHQKKPAPAPRSAAAASLPLGKREQYSDYRNDYFIKKDKPEEKEKTSVADPLPTDLLTQTDQCDDVTECNLKSIKNTPPLPRKKKRHRPGLQLCCFTVDRNGQHGEDV